MKNSEILDDDLLNNGKKVIDKRTKNLSKRTIIYLIIMLLGSYIIFYLEYRNSLIPLSFFYYKEMTITRIVVCFILSFILESFRFSVRKLKSKNSDILTLVDPFWFQIIEGAFAIWILDTVIKLISFVIF